VSCVEGLVGSRFRVRSGTASRWRWRRVRGQEPATRARSTEVETVEQGARAPSRGDGSRGPCDSRFPTPSSRCRHPDAFIPTPSSRRLHPAVMGRTVEKERPWEKERPPTEVGGGGREKGLLGGVLRLDSATMCTGILRMQMPETIFLGIALPTLRKPPVGRIRKGGGTVAGRPEGRLGRRRTRPGRTRSRESARSRPNLGGGANVRNARHGRGYAVRRAFRRAFRRCAGRLRGRVWPFLLPDGDR
jgi:hypothetical protein